jgi:hypothetical protein
MQAPAPGPRLVAGVHARQLGKGVARIVAHQVFNHHLLGRAVQGHGHAPACPRAPHHAAQYAAHYAAHCGAPLAVLLDSRAVWPAGHDKFTDLDRMPEVRRMRRGRHLMGDEDTEASLPRIVARCRVLSMAGS